MAQEDSAVQKTTIDSTLEANRLDPAPASESLNGSNIARKKARTTIGTGAKSKGDGIDFGTVEMTVNQIIKPKRRGYEAYVSDRVMSMDYRFPSLQRGMVQKQIGRGVETHTLATISAGAAIEGSLFQTSVALPFMRKSLALSYYQAGQLKDLNKSLLSVGRMIERKLEAIKLNTAAPDSRKTTLTEAVRDDLKKQRSEAIAAALSAQAKKLFVAHGKKFVLENLAEYANTAKGKAKGRATDYFAGGGLNKSARDFGARVSERLDRRRAAARETLDAASASPFRRFMAGASEKSSDFAANHVFNENHRSNMERRVKKIQDFLLRMIPSLGSGIKTADAEGTPIGAGAGMGIGGDDVPPDADSGVVGTGDSLVSLVSKWHADYTQAMEVQKDYLERILNKIPGTEPPRPDSPRQSGGTLSRRRFGENTSSTPKTPTPANDITGRAPGRVFRSPIYTSSDTPSAANSNEVGSTRPVEGSPSESRPERRSIRDRLRSTVDRVTQNPGIQNARNYFRERPVEIDPLDRKQDRNNVASRVFRSGGQPFTNVLRTGMENVKRAFSDRMIHKEDASSDQPMPRRYAAPSYGSPTGYTMSMWPESPTPSSTTPGQRVYNFSSAVNSLRNSAIGGATYMNVARHHTQDSVVNNLSNARSYTSNMYRQAASSEIPRLRESLASGFRARRPSMVAAGKRLRGVRVPVGGLIGAAASKVRGFGLSPTMTYLRSRIVGSPVVPLTMTDAEHAAAQGDTVVRENVVPNDPGHTASSAQAQGPSVKSFLGIGSAIAALRSARAAQSETTTDGETRSASGATRGPAGHTGQAYSYGYSSTGPDRAYHRVNEGYEQPDTSRESHRAKGGGLFSLDSILGGLGDAGELLFKGGSKAIQFLKDRRAAKLAGLAGEGLSAAEGVASSAARGGLLGKAMSIGGKLFRGARTGVGLAGKALSAVPVVGGFASKAIGMGARTAGRLATGAFKVGRPVASGEIGKVLPRIRPEAGWVRGALSGAKTVGKAVTRPGRMARGIIGAMGPNQGGIISRVANGALHGFFPDIAAKASGKLATMGRLGKVANFGLKAFKGAHGLGMGAIGSLAVGGLTDVLTKDGTFGNGLGHVAADALSGASMGAMFGPLGAAIGGAAGGLVGVIANARSLGSGLTWLKNSIVGQKAKVAKDGTIISAGKDSLFSRMQKGIFGSAATYDTLGNYVPSKLGLFGTIENGMRWMFGQKPLTADQYQNPASMKPGGAFSDSSSGGSSGSNTSRGGPFGTSREEVSSTYSRVLEAQNITTTKEYTQVIKSLPKDMQERVAKSKPLQFVVWSTSLQNGADAAVTMLKKNWLPEQDDQTFARKVLQERSTKFVDQDPNHRSAAFQQIGSEMNLVKKMFNDGQNGASVSTKDMYVAAGRPIAPMGDATLDNVKPARISDAETKQRTVKAINYFVKAGWTPSQAAGIVGNLIQESGLSEKAVGDSGAAGGIAQWHGDRRQAILKGLFKGGKTWSALTFEDQLAAVNWELRHGGEKAAGAALAQAQTPQQAAAIVSARYERPADKLNEPIRRAGIAKSAFAMFNESDASKSTAGGSDGTDSSGGNSPNNSSTGKATQGGGSPSMMGSEGSPATGESSIPAPSSPGVASSPSGPSLVSASDKAATSSMNASESDPGVKADTSATAALSSPIRINSVVRNQPQKDTASSSDPSIMTPGRSSVDTSMYFKQMLTTLTGIKESLDQNGKKTDETNSHLGDIKKKPTGNTTAISNHNYGGSGGIGGNDIDSTKSGSRSGMS